MMNTPSLPSIDSAPPAPGWPRRVRWAVSGLLLVHLGALLAGPCAVEPASLLCQRVWSVYRPYLEGAFLNHGYHFFAPEPGPSHLIRYELELADGTRQTGYFPDRQVHRPRLLYHRHFMLTEHLNAMADAGATQEVLSAQTSSFARHLLHERGARRVNLYLVRHLFPRPNDVLDGMRLNDPSLYRERSLGTFSAGDS
jgi:hypothetical protein